MSLADFITQLRHRRVFRAAAWYGAVAWLLIQVASTVVPEYDLPPWTVRAVIGALVLGFPVALLLAWAYDFTAAGILRASPDAPPESVSSVPRALLPLALALAAGVLLGIGAISSWRALDAPVERPGIAVLAFDVLGVDGNRVLAGGLHEAVLDELAHISGLRVIARTSVLRFATEAVDMREVGRILDVPYVLEGSVLREGDQLRVHAQLIDAATNEHLWSETYDRPATDLFGVQTALARDIAGQLRVKLLPQELARAAAPPTRVPAAYDAFLRGIAEASATDAMSVGPAAPGRRAALAAIDEALRLDPAFALAHAERARLLAQYYYEYRGVEPDAEAAREQALAAVTEALRLAPGLGEAHRALGLYYYLGHLDYARAEDELARARLLLPNDAASAHFLGLVRRRQNRWDEAIELFREAYRLNPSVPSYRANLAITLANTRRHVEFETLVTHNPKGGGGRVGLARSAFCRSGDTAAWRAVADAPIDDPVWIAHARYRAARYDGESDAALQIALAHGGELNIISFTTRRNALAEAYYLAGDATGAATAARGERVTIEKRLATNPDQLAVRGGLAELYLFEGRPDDARRVLREHLANTPLERGAMEHWWARFEASKVYAALGDIEPALEQLTLFQRGPLGKCGNELRRDPMFASLRQDPRFEALAAESDP